MKYKAIIFDLDNTLYAEDEYITLAYREMGAYLEKEFNYKASDVSFLLWQIRRIYGDASVLNKFLQFAGLSDSDDVLRKLIQIYQSVQGSLAVPALVQERLLELRKMNVPLGILTNGGVKTQENKLKLLNISHLFDHILISGTFSNRRLWKPDIYGYALLAQKFSCEPAAVLFVGDNPKTDEMGARNAGMDFIYAPEFFLEPVDSLIHS